MDMVRFLTCIKHLFHVKIYKVSKKHLYQQNNRQKDIEKHTFILISSREIQVHLSIHLCPS